MSNLLRIDASARKNASLSRDLGDSFINAWCNNHPGDRVAFRDVGLLPPPAISEDWIAAAFTPEQERSEEQLALLALSEDLIEEVTQADIIVITSPMYNYGMPTALKAWVDQVVRINRTFTFDLARGDYPLEPILTGKTLVMLTSTGEFGFAPGHEREHVNHLVPHLKTVSHYLGVVRHYHVGIEYQEFKDARHELSIKEAHAALPMLVDRIARDIGAQDEADAA